MKSGLLAGLYAMETLLALDAAGGELGLGRVIYVADPDEEIGSPVSSRVIAEVAATADAALVMEAARANGDIVSARKGMTHLRATVQGRAAHAGVEPEKTPQSARLVDAAVAIAAELGFELRDAQTGGASDANTTAAAGVPSVDGLGPVVGSDHSPLEYIQVDSIVPRTTLLAALLLSV